MQYPATFSNINIPALHAHLNSAQSPSVQMQMVALPQVTTEQRVSLQAQHVVQPQTTPQFQFSSTPVFSIPNSSPWHQYNSNSMNITEKEPTFGCAVDGTLAKDFNNYLVRSGIKPRSKSS